MLLLILMPLLISSTEPVTVYDREGFIEAIGPNTTIIIPENTQIILSHDSGKLANTFPETQYVSWEYEFDGYSLVIQDVQNLTIRGEDQATSFLLAEPRYVYVIDFQECTGVSVESLQLGHTTGGYCSSGVLGFENCIDAEVTDCVLFGCGTEGLSIRSTNGFSLINSVITDCTYGVMTCRNSTSLLFRNCIFRDNEQYHGVDMWYCRDVQFEDCLFRNNTADFTPAFFFTTGCTELSLISCVIEHASTGELFSNRELFHIEDLEVNLYEEE